MTLMTLMTLNTLIKLYTLVTCMSLMTPMTQITLKMHVNTDNTNHTNHYWLKKFSSEKTFLIYHIIPGPLLYIFLSPVLKKGGNGGWIEKVSMTWLRSSKEEGGGTSCLANFTRVTLAPEGAQLVSYQHGDSDGWTDKFLQVLFSHI